MAELREKLARFNREETAGTERAEQLREAIGEAVANDGKPCQMAPLTDSSFCFAHDPRRGRDRAEARKLGGRNRRTPPSAAEVAKDVRLRDVASIQERLESALADTLVQENSAQRSKTIGYLLGFALRALEVGELESRIAALEARIGATVPARVA